MENERAMIGALILIGLVLGANFVMVAIVRSAARSGKKGFFETLGRSFKSSSQRTNDRMDELRRRIQELDKGKKDRTEDSE